MELFPPDPTANLLPRDGTARYFGQVLDADTALGYYEEFLRGIQWKNDELVLFGKHIITARKVAWYGDAGLSYTYSGSTKQPLPWTPALANLKSLIERLTGITFNSCLLNLYHDGGEGMAWHSDDEKSLGVCPAIASISLGAERTFRFKHKTRPLAVATSLENGSLLLMEGTTQAHWLHCLPKSTKIKTPRINLTFRTIVRT